MIREHGPQSFEAEGPFSVINGLPWISDSNILHWMKSRLTTGQRVRVTVEVLEGEDEWRSKLAERFNHRGRATP